MYQFHHSVVFRCALFCLAAALLLASCACSNTASTAEPGETGADQSSQITDADEPTGTADETQAPAAADLSVPVCFSYRIEYDGGAFDEADYRLEWTENSVRVWGNMGPGQENTLAFDSVGKLTGGTYFYDNGNGETRNGTYTFTYAGDVLSGAMCVGTAEDPVAHFLQNFSRKCVFNEEGKITGLAYEIQNSDDAGGTEILYDADGRIEHILVGRGASSPEVRIQYDATGRRRACDIAPRDGSGGEQISVTYDYNDVRQLTELHRVITGSYAESDSVITFTYDDLGRLIAAREAKENGNFYVCTVTYAEASAAQARAWNDIVSCHIDFYGYDMPLISNGNAFSYFSNVTDFFRW